MARIKKLSARQCGSTEVDLAQAYFNACEPNEIQALYDIDIAQCLENGGHKDLAIIYYERYIRLRGPIEYNRKKQKLAQDRLDALRSELAPKVPEPAPEPPRLASPLGPATVVLRSELRGALLHGLPQEPDGITIDREARYQLPAGDYQLRLQLPGFRTVKLRAHLEPGRTVELPEIRWREHLLPKRTDIGRHWISFVKSGRTPEGYEALNNTRIFTAISVPATLVGASLLGFGFGIMECDPLYCNRPVSWIGWIGVGIGFVGVMSGIFSLDAWRESRKNLPSPGKKARQIELYDWVAGNPD